MRFLSRRPGIINVFIVLVTMVLVMFTLVVARAEAEPPIVLQVGDTAPMDLVASAFIEVPNEAATEDAREQARINTPVVYEIRPEISSQVEADIRGFFKSIRDGAFGEPLTADEVLPDDDSVSPPSTTSTTVATTTTTTTTTTTLPPAADGEAEGEVGAGAVAEDTTTTSSTTTSSTTTTTTLPRVDREEREALLLAEYVLFEDAIPTLVGLHLAHLDDLDEGGDGFFDEIEDAIVSEARNFLDNGIRNLNDVRGQILSSPPRIFIRDVVGEDAIALDRAAAEVLINTLQANELIDSAATDAARDFAAAGVEDIVETYNFGQPIVQEGEIISETELAAIDALDLLEPEAGTSRRAAAALGGLGVLIAALFLWRIAPSRWSQPKHMALLGVLLSTAAAISRIPELLAVEDAQLAYLIPAAMLGYSAAILYDPRTALLTAIPMAMFTGISTQDPAITVYAAVATVAPIAFVSAVSTRRQLRFAVLLGAVVLAPVAGAVAWFFSGSANIVPSAVAGFAGALIGGFIGQGLVSFLENLFRITTTVTLLDLTDRNHPALRLIEDRAPGTFNHSILVGNLAGRAARAIDADPLFAQAAAFYHDLGKTEHPQYFIENQFGVSNPHDELDPAESASIIRRHVSDGLRLARQHRIPSDVAAGISQHHGTGLMRYFYHKALDVDPAVDPSLYRHQGEKPQRKEMAILMISDAVEGAARALAQQEDPTADSLKKLVDSVVGEKLEDGQLDESALTFGDLTRVKQALVQALIGYYHTRIPYPGFPGPPAEGA